MLRSLRNTKRLIGIAIIFAREDALFIFHDLQISPFFATLGKLFRSKKNSRKGVRLSAALEKLGPTFIKLGQTLSTRSDLIGDELADDLSRLRDKLAPFPTSVARQIIEDELERPLSELFSHFDDVPVAAASIAQVHKAITKTGKVVAVKILRPDIEKAFAQDLDLFFWVADIMESKLSSSKRLKPRKVVETFKEAIFFELDLRFEAAAAKELADNIAHHQPGFRVPQIDWQLTSRRVLTAQWIDGIPLADVTAIKASGLNPDEILQKAANSLFSQVFVDGFFHADLHPGNLFVDSKGDLVAVDFGIMGRLDWNSRVYMAEILRGFLTHDYKHVAEMHFKAGYVPADKSKEAFTQACMAVAQPIIDKPVNEISVAKLLGQMFNIAAEFEMETQPQLLLLQKTMMVTEGVGRMLNPNLNMWELSRPLIERWAKENFGLQAKLKDTAKSGAQTLQRFPEMLGYAENTLKMLGSGKGLVLHPDSIAAINQSRTKQHAKYLRLGWTALLILSFLILLDIWK